MSRAPADKKKPTANNRAASSTKDLNNKDTLIEWASQYLKVVKSNNKVITIHCGLPGHEDKTASAAIMLDSWMYVCQKCGKMKISEFCKLSGIPDPWQPEQQNTRYDYKKNGKIVYCKERYGNKKFVFKKPDGSTGLNGIKHVLYHEDETREALKAGKPIIICEGEKDVDRLLSAGFTAVSNDVGADPKGWKKEHYDIFDPFGNTVYLSPDADKPGIVFMQHIAEELQQRDVEVHWLDYGFPIKEDHGKDVSDWLDAGGNLQGLIDKTPLYVKQDIKIEPAAEPENDPGVYGNKAFPIIHINSLKITTPDYLIDNFLETGILFQLFGRTGAGKSFLILDVAFCIASGIEWHEHEIKKPGAVLYILGEGMAGVTRRLAALKIKYGKEDQAIPFYISTVPAALTDIDFMLLVQESIKALPEIPVLIIIDTLNMNFGAGNENSTQDMSIALMTSNSLRIETGATVALVHHSGHAAVDRSRGSSSLDAAMDRTYRLDKKEELLTLSCTKSKETELPEPMCFKLAQVEFEDGLYDSAVLADAMAAEEIPEMRGKYPQIAMRLLSEEYDKYKKNLSLNGFEEEQPNVKIEHFRELCKKAGIPSKKISETITRLKRDKLISLDEYYIYPL